mgnify:CR=1 FL=1
MTTLGSEWKGIKIDAIVSPEYSRLHQLATVNPNIVIQVTEKYIPEFQVYFVEQW